MIEQRWAWHGNGVVYQRVYDEFGFQWWRRVGTVKLKNPAHRYMLPDDPYWIPETVLPIRFTDRGMEIGFASKTTEAA
jgi:hypothetical protein